MADSSLSTTQNNTLDSRDEDLDASIEADISQEPISQDAMQVDAVSEETEQPSGSGIDVPAAAAAEPRIPAKKDASLREFLSNMDDYAPIVCACTSL
jgi:transcription initiation factor TFIID subunit 10